MEQTNIAQEDGKREWRGVGATPHSCAILLRGGKVTGLIKILDTPTCGTLDAALPFSSHTNLEELEQMTDLNDTFENYRDFVDEVSEVYPSDMETFLGLPAEVGELTNVIKKIEREEVLSLKRLEQLHDEMGDVLHYFVRLMNHYDIELEDIIQVNIDKLRERHSAG